MIKQNIYVLFDNQNEYVANLLNKQLQVERIYSVNSEATADILSDISRRCSSEYFYIIKADRELIFDFDFTFKPDCNNRQYVHVWGDSVKLYNTHAVQLNPSGYDDIALRNGNIELKSESDKIYSNSIFDIVYISYDEEDADGNYNKLKSRFPRVKRVHGVKGIFAAHHAASIMAMTDMVYVVDADADIMPDFNFDYNPHSSERQSVIVWHSHNPINDMEYGYGAVKLFPTELLRNYVGSPIDFTTTVSSSFKVIEEVSNITRFNTDPYSAWRSGFRECVKLSSNVIINQDKLTAERLAVWCTMGEDREFGDFTIAGAREGAEYGRQYKDQPDMLKLINDYEWLAHRFNF